MTYTIKLTDSGPDAATNVKVTDLLPAGLTFVGATPSQGSYDPSTGLWTVGTVTPGAPQTLQTQARAACPSAQTNIASISHADQFDPNAGNNAASATEVPAVADLTL